MTFEPAVLRNEERIILALRSLYARYGYAPYHMSKFEEYDLYARNKDFLISSDVITFTDTNGKLKALKPDVTLSIVRSSRLAPGELKKLYYDENVYRVSGGSRGFREIMQVGLECLGAVDDYCLGEVLLLAAESLRLLSPENRLNISHLGIVGALLETLPLSEEARARALRCIGEKNLHELAALCLEAGAAEDAVARLCGLVRCSGAPETVLPKLRELGAPEEAVAQLERLTALLREGGVGDTLCIDFSVLGDLRYYNGVAFNGFVRGVPQSVISGGQYDKLLARMGRRGRAVGFAVYLDRLDHLDPGTRKNDADTVLLYDEGADPLLVAAAVRALAAEGAVLALKALPEGLRCGRCLKLTESGVIPLA